MKKINAIVYYELDDRCEPTSVEIWAEYQFEGNASWVEEGIEVYDLTKTPLCEAIEKYIKVNHLGEVARVIEYE